MTDYTIKTTGLVIFRLPHESDKQYRKRVKRGRGYLRKVNRNRRNYYQRHHNGTLPNSTYRLDTFK